MADLSAVESIFFAAQGKHSPEDRAAFLQEACAGDAELHRLVERLLAAQPQVGSFLDPDDAGRTGPPTPDAAPATTAPVTAEQIGQVIAGRYVLVQKLGEGGMGSVWVAEQSQPVKRRVALKMIRADLASPTVLRRFEAERQALALMDHPNIAKILDAGSWEAPGSQPPGFSRPYFVMELVKGVPITRYCDELHLSIRERLRLFVPVCQAIQHAHQKGIIHRDIKPSNVLVAIQEGVPVPKVIDFGVAKAVNQRLTEATLHTQIGTMVGTLEYMSPEQAELSELDIDTRADVYALGVLLYELLTGTTPLNRAQLKDAAIFEMLRIIRQDEPPRPSTRLTESKASIPERAAQRRTEPARLAKEVRGDLDWIVMKCLEKDRTRRYESASGLARDVERFLADQVVEAGPPSAVYRLRKLLRRNRRTAVVAGVLTVFLIAVLANHLVGWFRLKEARARAGAEAQRAWVAEQLALDRLADAEKAQAAERKAKDGAMAAEKRARNEADSYTGALAFMQMAVGKEDLKTALHEMSKDLERSQGGAPLTRAAVHELIATSYEALQDWRSAEPHLAKSYDIRKRELGADHRDTVRTLQQLGIAYQANGHNDLAASCFHEVLASVRRTGQPPPAFTITLRNVAARFRSQKRYADAETLLAESLERLSREMPGSANEMDDRRLLAEVREAQDKFAEAEPLRVKLVEYRRPAGPDAVEWFPAALADLGLNLVEQKKYAEAESPLRECVRLCDQKHPNHWIRFQATSLLGAALAGQKKFADAEPLLVSGYEGLRRHRSADHADGRPLSTDALERVVQLYRDWGKKEQADAWRKRRGEASAAPKSPG